MLKGGCTMATQAINLEARASSLKSVLSNRAQKRVIDEALQAANGDWTAALIDLKERLPAAALQKVTLAYALADWSDDNSSIVNGLAEQPNVPSLRDVALNFNVKTLPYLMQSNYFPAYPPAP